MIIHNTYISEAAIVALHYTLDHYLLSRSRKKGISALVSNLSRENGIENSIQKEMPIKFALWLPAS